jgi:1-acyl-sn-glycerol-3-phosphate acyltransferase
MHKLLRVYHAVIFWSFGLLFILMPGMPIVMMCTLLRDKKNIAYYWGLKWWGRLTLLVGGITIRRIGVQNVPRSGTFIFAANHSSSLDILLISAAIPMKFKFVMDEILFKIPLLGFYSTMMGLFPISRRSPVRAIAQMNAIVARLKEGDSIAFFPEGMRSRDGKLLEFKSGIGLLVEETGVPVIPVLIRGTYDLMPRMNPLFRPGVVTIEFGPPLYLDRNMGQIQIANAVHAKVAAMISGQSE